MKLVHKLILGFVVFALMSALGGYLAISHSKKILENAFIENTESLTVAILHSLEKDVENKINEFHGYTNDLGLRQAVLVSNLEFEKIENRERFLTEKDRDWISVDKNTLSPFMQQIIDNKLSRALREKIETYRRIKGYDVIGEIFITNKYGANVAQSGKTSDYRQDDEGWWQTAKKNQLYIGDLTFDESANMHSVIIALTIEDDDYNFIGVMKVVLNMKYFLNVIKELEPHGIHKRHKNMKFKILTKEGNLIYDSTGDYLFLQNVSNILSQNHVFTNTNNNNPKNEKVISHIFKENDNKNVVSIAYANSTGIKQLQSLNWVLVVEQDEDELFKPVKEMQNHLILISAFLIIFGLCVGLSVVTSIMSSVKKLRKAARKIGSGDLDIDVDVKSSDELGELSHAFNKMAKNLKTTTVNRDELANEIRKRRMAEDKIMNSEERFRSVAENASDSIIYTDSRGEIIFWNKASEEIFGHSAEEVVGHSINCIIPDQFRNVHKKAIHKARKQEKLTHVRESKELVALKKDGDQFPIELSLSTWDIGKQKYFTAIIRDISDRKRSEKVIEEQVGRLSALRSIDRAIIASLDLNVTLDVFLSQVTAQLGIDAATVLLLNPYSQTLEHIVSKGFRSNALKFTKLRLGESNAGRAALERRIVHIPNLKEYLDGFATSETFVDEDFVTYFAVPLIAKRQVKGVLEIFQRQYLQADQEWLEFLEAIADQGAIALDNATMFDDLQRSNMELSLAYDTTIEGWARALDMRDRETEGHSRRVTELSVRIAREFRIKDEEIVQIRRGALLHDIGKMAIPDDILLKPGKLTDEEWKIMKLHPVYARDLLYPIEYLRPAMDIPYYHHEKWDGTGYPEGLKGKNIPLAARIFAVVDVWDALRSDRPYRPAWPKEKVEEHIRSQVGKHFDAGVIEVFLSAELY